MTLQHPVPSQDSAVPSCEEEVAVAMQTSTDLTETRGRDKVGDKQQRHDFLDSHIYNLQAYTHTVEQNWDLNNLCALIFVLDSSCSVHLWHLLAEFFLTAMWHEVKNPCWAVSIASVFTSLNFASKASRRHNDATFSHCLIFQLLVMDTLCLSL